MIATPRFVYLHLHKSGGTFVNDCLLRFFPDARQLGYHLPARLIPATYHGLPVLGFVRNPWSYYVSWFTFQSKRPVKNALFRVLSEDGRLGFAGTIRNMLSLGVASGKLDELLPLLPEAYGNRGLNLPRAALEPIRDSGQGFYAFLYHYMFGGHSGSIHLGRNESLREDLLDFFRSREIPVSDELRAHVESARALNASDHRPYAEYYDDALRDLVAERDASVIRAFGYTFG